MSMVHEVKFVFSGNSKKGIPDAHPDTNRGQGNLLIGEIFDNTLLLKIQRKYFLVGSLHFIKK